MDPLDSLKFFLDIGSYQAKIKTSYQLDILRNHIKKYHIENDLKKYCWRTEGVAGHFEAIRIFEEDKGALNDYLMQIGVLPVVVDIKWKSIEESDKKRLLDWILPQFPLIRFTPNKNMHFDKDTTIEFDEKTKKLNLSQQLTAWRTSKIKYDLLQFEWETLRNKLQHQLNPGERVKVDHGTISSLPQDPIISGESLYKLLGSSAVEKYGTVNYRKLTFYMLRGLFSKSELNIYRRVVEVRLRYVLKVI